MKYSLPLDVLSYPIDSHGSQPSIHVRRCPAAALLAAVGKAATNLLKIAALGIVLASALVSPVRAWDPYYGTPYRSEASSAFTF